VLTILRPRLQLQAAIEGIAIGLLLGLIDVHSTSGDWFEALSAYLGAGSVLGLRHGRRAWQAWLPLGSSLYLMHLAAIGCGFRPPYVEADVESAAACLIVSWPAALGLGLGALARFFVSVILQSAVRSPVAAKRDRTEDAAPERADNLGRQAASSWPPAAVSEARAAPRLTVWRLTVMIAVIALHLAFARLLLQNDPFFGFCTFYSARYSESRFNTIRVGMTGAEVEGVIGPPLRKQRWNEHAGPPNEEMWEYSARRDVTANFWRRWVLFENDKVSHVISDFWVD
jgi:hypothetical protein